MEEKKKRIKKPKKAVKRHVVVFQDDAGAVIKTSFVPHGQAADPPELPVTKKREGHYDLFFDGWDQDYSNISSNLVLKPVWRKEPRKYLVMYFHEDGTMIGMETVPYKSPAPAAIHPVKDSDDEFDYPFIGWTANLNSIEGDTNAKAIFGKVRRIFTVRFFHEDGSLLKEEKVHYDEPAHPPILVEKKADAVYHYRFAGWTYPTSHIRTSLNIHAIFEDIYNEYHVTFYEEGRMHSEQLLHYGDSIIYPDLKRKGYDLIWDRHVDKVRKDEAIYASWQFSNPIGKIIENDIGRFRILNPSIHKGTVICQSYCSLGEKDVVVQASVKLGDYYYQIAEIDAYAFKKCKGMEKLSLPDTVKIIRDKGLAGCSRLRKVRLGKGIRSLGKCVFKGDRRLTTVDFLGQEPKKVSKDVMTGAPTGVYIRFRKNGRLLPLDYFQK